MKTCVEIGNLAPLSVPPDMGTCFLIGHWVEQGGNNKNDTSDDSIFVIGGVGDNGKLKAS